MTKHLSRERRFGQDDSGASEVLGDILLVVMSVIMLSTLAGQLLSMPAPSGLITADTAASYDGTNITIEHLGGNPLKDPFISIRLGKPYAVPNSYQVSSGNADGVLTVGESWKYNVSTFLNPDDTVYVAIVDTKNNRVISEQYVQKGMDYGQLPDIGLTPSDISFWRNGALIDEGANAPMISENMTINITVHNYGKVKIDKDVHIATSVYMFSSEALEQLTIPANTLNPAGQANDNITMSVNWSIKDWGPHTIYVSVIPLHNESIFTNNYAKKVVRVGPGIVTPFAPDLNVTALYFSSSHPQHGDTVKMFVRIANQGGIPANVSLTYWDNGNVITTDYNISVSSGQLLETSTLWIPTMGGIHTMMVNVSVLNIPPDDANLLNNDKTVLIEVLPTIMLVDDDKAGDGGLKDSVSSMRAALSSVGAQYTLYSVVGDGPQYSIGPLRKRLMDFDLVIWMCGYEKSSTLTPADISNLTKYLNAGGKLWLIGQDITDDLKVVNNTFLTNYLHVTNSVADGGSADPQAGVAANFVTNPLSIAMKAKPWASGLSDKADALTLDAKCVGAFRNTSSAAIDSLMYNTSTNSNVPTYTMAFFAFQFDQIDSANDRTVLTYEMLKWFGALARWGRDLAIADQVLTSLTPSYMDEVNITVYVRNNGPDNEPMGGDKVQVLFLIDNMPIPAYKVWFNGTLQNASMTTNPVEVPNITALGGTVKVTMTWVASKVGAHSIRVRVDPFDFIEEVDETNNEVWGASGSVLNVRFGLLVVDDDDSSNNRIGGTYYNSTNDMTSALDRLGYRYSVYVVAGPAVDGPNATYLERFNSVIWLTGQCSAALGTPITINDAAAIKGFLAAGDNRGFWLIGQDTFATGAYGLGTFTYDSLHVTNINRNQGTPNPLIGVKGDPLGHGINYTTGDPFGVAGGGSTLTPRADAQGILYRNPSAPTYNAIRYYDTTLGSKVVYCGWEFSAIENRSGTQKSEYKAELAYMVLHWFGMPELRPELRVTRIDMYYGSMTPMETMNPAMGRSYVIKAIIANIGGTRGDCSVRFTDGKTVIGTTFLSVGPDGNSIAEVVWTPLYAGERNIWVWADPDQLIPEIFQFNNIAEQGLRSYFFYDDMESGTKNWRHDSTIVRINGESALEFMDAGNVSSSIMGSWEWLQGFKKTTEDYHSQNTSFKLKEPTVPLDVVLVMDNSKSMDLGTPSALSQAKAAAKALLAQLSNDSRVAITTYAGGGNIKWDPTVSGNPQFWTMNAAGRTSANTAVDGINSQSVTQTWDNIGKAFTNLNALTWANHTPVLVTLGDGCDRNGDDSILPTPADINQLEGGSNAWAPWHSYGAGIVNYNNHFSKFGGSALTNGFWLTTQNFGGGARARSGLLSLPIRVYAIGLNLDHHEPPNMPQVGVKPGEGVYDANAYYTGGVESGTVEYSLWRIATTSGGKYFYAPSGSDLLEAFDMVADELSSLTLSRDARQAGPRPPPAEEQASGEGSEGGASARSPNIPGEGDNYALTSSFDLRGVTEAKLGFWHKYNLRMGFSGGVILVGNSTDNITFKYKYMTPAQSYTGNIKTDVFRYDDFNSEVRWCWNGVSGNGVFSWEYVEVNLAQYCGQQYVKVMFDYVRAGGGGGTGWYIDDVEVKVSRSNSVAVATTCSDQWELVHRGDVLGTGGDNADAYSGSYAWLCHNPSATIDYLKPGIDNSLITVPIDLTNALDATLLAKFKFNINYTDGRPPDGFRVEVSSDNGVQWRPINFGVRAAWKVSGTEAAGANGLSYTGVNLTNNWVLSTTLERLNCNLTGWAGQVIQLRFRVVTRNDTINHYFTNSGFGGFYVDDVMVFGNTTTGARAAPGRAPAAPPATGIEGNEPASVAPGDWGIPIPGVAPYVPSFDLDLFSEMRAVAWTDRMAVYAQVTKGGELQ